VISPPEPETGVRLDRWLDEKPRTWREVAEVFFDVGQSLAASHAAGIAHDEIRINQISVDADGRGKAFDLKAAEAELSSPGASGLRTAAVSLEQRLAAMDSTEAAAYLAPEQFRGRAPDARSNQFSFCVALYRALYQQTPFDHDWAVSEDGQSDSRRTPLGSISFKLLVQSYNRTTLIDLAKEVLAGNLRPPPHFTDVPGWLEQIVRRGLRPDPDERFASMDELLEAMAAQLGEGARRRLAGRRGRVPKWVVLGGIVALVIAGIAAAVAALSP
jgi:serine/threonine protein kinase